MDGLFLQREAILYLVPTLQRKYRYNKVKGILKESLKKICAHPQTKRIRKSVEESFTLLTALFDGVKLSLNNTVLIIFYVSGLVWNAKQILTIIIRLKSLPCGLAF